MASELYALGWGYDQTEIGKRVRVIKDLYSPGGLEPETFETVGSLPYPLYILVRTDEPSIDQAKFGENPRLFHRVFSAGPIAVFELDREAFRSTAAGTGQTG